MVLYRLKQAEYESEKLFALSHPENGSIEIFRIHFVQKITKFSATLACTAEKHTQKATRPNKPKSAAPSGNQKTL